MTSLAFGVHAGLQNTSTDELQSLWRRIEDLDFDWISIWDHFYSADLQGYECLEAVSMHTALAMTTERVRCGSLVYCAGYRHPAVLANAIATIDHLSGGRVDVGLGAGWAVTEYNAYGIPFPVAKERLDILEESVQCVRGLLHDDVTNFEGKYFTLTDARCEPRPVQRALPIWIGGAGEKRTLRIAARHADGWNAPFLSPDDCRHKNAVLDAHCADASRDPSEVRRTVNLGIVPDEAALHDRFGAIAEFVRPGVLIGGAHEIADRIGEYAAAGISQINLALRAPFDVDDLERAAEAIAAFR